MCFDFEIPKNLQKAIKRNAEFIFVGDATLFGSYSSVFVAGTRNGGITFGMIAGLVLMVIGFLLKDRKKGQ